MIKEIKKSLEIVIDKRKIELPKKLTKDIKSFWKNVIKQEPYLWDGSYICVEEMKELDDKIVILCKRTTYSHYLYDERIGVEDKKYWCSVLWGGILLKTKDDYLILGEMAEDTAYPHGLQIAGGGIDKLDEEAGKIDIEKTIKRELKEEFNIDLYDKNVTEYEIKYLEMPEGRRHAYGVIAFGNLNMTKEQMREHYETYLEEQRMKKGEIEFQKLNFIPIQNAYETLKSINNPKRDYLFPLFELVENKNSITIYKIHAKH